MELDKKYREGFGAYAMGGSARVKKLNELFINLREKRVELMVCSKGLAGPIRKILHDTNLLHHFSSVYSNTGTQYGETEFDKKVKHSSRLPLEEIRKFIVGGSEYKSKQDLMRRLLVERRLPKEAGILVEDDAEQIRKCQRVSRTFFVEPPRGLSSSHMTQLLAMIN